MRGLSTEDNVNDIRSNLIEMLLALYKALEGSGELHLRHENNALHWVPGQGLWIEGCAGEVSVKAYNYGSVTLGAQIRSYNHLPYQWLRSLTGVGDQD